jgi:tetratricopeptide (TPR) repeat protein
MGRLRLKDKKEFEKFVDMGLKALGNGRPEKALKYFEEADTLARHCNDRVKRLDVLNPMANSLWALGEFDKAKQKLALATKISRELAILDELAFAYSNLGRLEAVKSLKAKSVTKQNKNLKKEALPYFMRARRMLSGHERLHFRYANAMHGSVIAALAQDYKKAAQLTTEGLDLAFKKAHKYNKQPTYKVNPSGLEYFATAAKLIELGSQNPASHEYKKYEKTARELVR